MPYDNAPADEWDELDEWDETLGDTTDEDEWETEK